MFSFSDTSNSSCLWVGNLVTLSQHQFDTSPSNQTILHALFIMHWIKANHVPPHPTLACSGWLPKGLSTGHFHQWPLTSTSVTTLWCHVFVHAIHLTTPLFTGTWQAWQARRCRSRVQLVRFLWHVLLAPVWKTLGDRSTALLACSSMLCSSCSFAAFTFMYSDPFCDKATDAQSTN